MDMLKDQRFDFTILENDIVRDTDKYSKNELLAYIAICYHADKQGTCFPSYEGIARIMRASRTTAINAIQGLVEKGVIKLENRKADEKKKELTSNLYTLVSNKFWEQTSLENKKYLIKKGADYKKRYAKGKVTKIANQNAKSLEDKKNTPDSTAIESSVSDNLNTLNNSYELSIPQEVVVSTEESYNKNGEDMTNNQVSPELQKRLDLFKDAGIKYVPYKSESALIQSLNIDVIKQAIDITVEQSSSRSWRYFLTTYDSIVARINREMQQQREQQKFVPSHKPRYNNLKGGIGMCKSNWDGKDLWEWDADEFNRAVELKQAQKWK